MLGLLFFILIIIVVLPIIALFSLFLFGKRVRNGFRKNGEKNSEEGDVSITHSEQRQRVNPDIGEYTNYEEIE